MQNSCRIGAWQWRHRIIKAMLLKTNLEYDKQRLIALIKATMVITQG